MLDITKTTILIGLEKPFRALHMSDNHVALADERETMRKRELAKNRTEAFSRNGNTALSFLEEMVAYAKKEGMPILHTGDLYDFVSYKNLEFARDILRDVDHIYAVGNHEYSLYLGEATEDLHYKMQSYPLVQKYFRNNLFFDSRIINGVNFIALDDGYYNFYPEQLEKLKKEAEKGLPMVLMMHNPLYTPEFFELKMAAKPVRGCAFLTGVPEELMRNYSEYRYTQQKATQTTFEMMDYIAHQPLIRAILCGHLHANYDVPMASGITQYVSGYGPKGIVREITFT